MKLLVDYLLQWAPHIPPTFRGAALADIQELELLIGAPIPESHREFLIVAGRDLGDFHIYQDEVDFTIDALLDYYRSGEFKPRPQFTLLGVDRGASGCDYFLERRQPNIEPEVVRFPSTAIFDSETAFFRCYESLADMLISLAFFVVRLPLLSFQFQLEAEQPLGVEDPSFYDMREAFPDVLQKLGFSVVPHTSRISQCYERGDAAVAFYQPPNASPYIQVGASDEIKLHQLCEVLADNFRLNWSLA